MINIDCTLVCPPVGAAEGLAPPVSVFGYSNTCSKHLIVKSSSVCLS